MQHWRTQLSHERPRIDQRFVDDAFGLGNFLRRSLGHQSFDLTELHANQRQQLSQVVVQVGRQPFAFALLREIQFG